METAARSSTAMAWLRSSPEGKKQQVDAALEFALDATLKERPPKPLLLVAQKCARQLRSLDRHCTAPHAAAPTVLTLAI